MSGITPDYNYDTSVEALNPAGRGLAHPDRIEKLTPSNRKSDQLAV